MDSSAPPAISPLATQRRLPDEVTAVLAQRIADGTFPAGGKLPSTRALAAAFQVSAPIIREALSRLKYDGLVEPRQGSGVFVRPGSGAASLRLGDPSVDAALLADVLEMRLHVEQSCAELAALRRSDRDLAGLRRALDAMACAEREGADGSEADVEFHVGIARATRNAALMRLVEYVHGAIGQSVRAARANSRRTPGLPAEAQREHEAIVRAIAAQDAAAAREAARAHLLNAAQRLARRAGRDLPAAADLSRR